MHIAGFRLLMSQLTSTSFQELNLPRGGGEGRRRVPHFSSSRFQHHPPLLSILFFTFIWQLVTLSFRPAVSLLALCPAVPLYWIMLQEVLERALLFPVQLNSRLKKERKLQWTHLLFCWNSLSIHLLQITFKTWRLHLSVEMLWTKNISPVVDNHWNVWFRLDSQAKG